MLISFSSVAAVSSGNTVQNDPRYARYFKMIRMGVPEGQVKQRMEFEGVDPSVLGQGLVSHKSPRLTIVQIILMHRLNKLARARARAKVLTFPFYSFELLVSVQLQALMMTTTMTTTTTNFNLSSSLYFRAFVLHL